MAVLVRILPAALILLAAASPKPPLRVQVANADLIPGTDTAVIVPDPQPSKRTAQSADGAGGNTEPAPVPNADAAAPTPQGAPQPSGGLKPSVFSEKREYQGDGFSRDSSADSAEQARSRPGFGLGLSVPVQ
jgi:hypothetical protein